MYIDPIDRNAMKFEFQELASCCRYQSIIDKRYLL